MVISMPSMPGRAVQSAIDHGVTLFDTSETYGPFTSEALLGRALGTRRKEVVIVTKVGFTFRDDPEAPGLHENPRARFLRPQHHRALLRAACGGSGRIISTCC